MLGFDFSSFIFNENGGKGIISLNLGPFKLERVNMFTLSVVVDNELFRATVVILIPERDSR